MYVECQRHDIAALQPRAAADDSGQQTGGSDHLPPRRHPAGGQEGRLAVGGRAPRAGHLPPRHGDGRGGGPGQDRAGARDQGAPGDVLQPQDRGHPELLHVGASFISGVTLVQYWIEYNRITLVARYEQAVLRLMVSEFHRTGVEKTTVRAVFRETETLLRTEARDR